MDINTFPVITDDVPPPGTTAGDAARLEYIGEVLALCGDVKRLWVPKSSDGTTSTDASRNAATLTHAATIAGRMSQLGSGLAVSFDGVADYSSYPDAADLTHGDSSTDEAFTVVTLLNPTALSGNQEICSKFDTSTGATQKEWRTFCSGASFFANSQDDSAGARIGRSSSSNLSNATWALMTSVYDGSGVAAGWATYKQGTQWDTTDDTSGTYVAMENKTSVVYIGASKGAAAMTNYFSGKVAMNLIMKGRLNTDQMWTLTALTNGFFGLTLS